MDALSKRARGRDFGDTFNDRDSDFVVLMKLLVAVTFVGRFRSLLFTGRYESDVIETVSGYWKGWN